MTNPLPPGTNSRAPAVRGVLGVDPVGIMFVLIGAAAGGTAGDWGGRLDMGPTRGEMAGRICEGAI